MQQRLNFRFAAKRDKRLAILTSATRCVRSIPGGHLVIIRICQVYLPNRASSRIYAVVIMKHFDGMSEKVLVLPISRNRKRDSIVSFAVFYLTYIGRGLLIGTTTSGLTLVYHWAKRWIIYYFIITSIYKAPNLRDQPVHRRVHTLH